MQECPRFSSCSVNHCPLDAEQQRHLPDANDRERKCTMEKGVRSRIGQKYPDLLPLLGLTPAEVAGRARWERKTPREREAFAERGRLLLSKHGKA
jgi:hypothetical protein